MLAGLGLRAAGSGFRAWGLGRRVEGLGFRFHVVALTCRVGLSSTFDASVFQKR